MTDWLGIVIAAAALVLAFVGWVDGRRQVRDSAADAKAAADSAALAATSAARSADALEAQAARFEPRWDFEWLPDGRMSLTNRNGEDAVDVTVEVDRPWYFFEHEELVIDGVTEWEPVARGEPRTRHEDLITTNSSVAYIPSQGPRNLDARLTVRWSRPSGQRVEWSMPLRGSR